MMDEGEADLNHTTLLRQWLRKRLEGPQADDPLAELLVIEGDQGLRLVEQLAEARRARRTARAPQPKLSLALFLLMPIAALAQGSPFDTGFTAIQSLFTGTIAKVASLVAIVIGGYGFAHGEPGAKKALAGVAAGTGIAVLAVNVLSWLWGV